MRAGTTILGACLLLVSACGSSGGETSAATSSTTPSTVTEGPLAATEVLEGDCLTGVVIGAAERGRIESARKVSCFSDHTLEVYATFTLGAADFERADLDGYPGRARVVGAADRGCAERIEARTADPSAYGLIALWPTATSWADGDRTVACAVFSPDGSPFQAPQFS